MRRWVSYHLFLVHGSFDEFFFFSLVIVGIWEAMELLDTMQDDSDPDVRSSFFFFAEIWSRETEVLSQTDECDSD